MAENLILDKHQIIQKIKRLAFQIYEENFREDEVVLAGIYDRGYFFAKDLQTELNKIAPFKTALIKVSLDKLAKTQCPVELDHPVEFYKDKSIVLCDDVLNTGRTVALALKPFLETSFKKLQVAVIVDRNHQLFPVSANFVGYTLATTIKEHIEVSFEENRYGAFLH